MHSLVAEPPDEIETIHLRHSEIEHDHVRLDGVEHGKTLLAVRRLEDLELTFEGHPVESSPGRIIIDDKHSRHTGDTSWPCPTQAGCQVKMFATAPTYYERGPGQDGSADGGA